MMTNVFKLKKDFEEDQDTKIEPLIKEGWINESENTHDVSNDCKWDYTVEKTNEFGKYMLVGVLDMINCLTVIVSRFKDVM